MRRRARLQGGGAIATIAGVLLLGLAAWHPLAAAVGAWSPIGPPDGATVQALAFAPSDPSIVYAGLAGGGVQRSADGGRTWRPASFGLGNPLVNALAVDPTDADTVYAGTQVGFFRSVDGGKHWQTSSPVNGLKVHAIAVHPAHPHVLYIGTAMGIYRSANGGAGWQLLTVGLIPPNRFDFEVVALAIDPVDPRQIYAAHIGVRDGIHKTVDGGRVWVALRKLRVDALAVDPVHDSTVWAAGDDGVWRSVDGGKTWGKVRVEPAHALLVDPSDPDRVYAANAQDVQVTTDGGLSWQTLPAGPRPGGALALAADPAVPGHLLAGTIGAGVYSSTDGGATWTASGLGLVNTAVAAVAFDDADTAIFVAGAAGVYRTLDGGATWDLTSFGGAKAVAVSGSPSDPHTLYAAIFLPPQVARTVDGGATWQTASILSASALAVSLDDPATLYAATPQALMKSTDGGVTWTAVFEATAGRFVDSVVIDPLDPAVVYLLYGGQLWKSSDRGSTWEMLLADGQLIGIAIGRDTPRTILVSNNRSVFGSTDGGKIWSVLARNRLFPAALAVDPKDPRTLYIGSGGGIEQSLDGGANWRPFNRGLYARGLNQLLFDPGDFSRLYAATSTAGLFVFDFAH
jgi:photosystem II stability/assembly factor-like uncharacterized protein